MRFGVKIELYRIRAKYVPLAFPHLFRIQKMNPVEAFLMANPEEVLPIDQDDMGDI